MLAAYARHRRRFAAEVSSLEAAALRERSRCSEWSVADVFRHGYDVDGWMRAIWSGGELPFSSFDPVTTPHEFVVAGRAIPDDEARDRFVESSESMADDVGNSGPERWGLPSLSPLGFVPWWMSTLHVFYDSWVHERDVLLPLGVDVPVEPDEAQPVLAYSLALVGTFIAQPTDANIEGVRLVVSAEPPVLATLTATDDLDAAKMATIIDALSGRGATVDEALAGLDPALVRDLGALARRFGATSAGNIRVN